MFLYNWSMIRCKLVGHMCKMYIILSFYHPTADRWLTPKTYLCSLCKHFQSHLWAKVKLWLVYFFVVHFSVLNIHLFLRIRHWCLQCRRLIFKINHEYDDNGLHLCYVQNHFKNYGDNNENYILKWTTSFLNIRNLKMKIKFFFQFLSPEKNLMPTLY